MKIRNIVFDVGNVLVRWDPLAITRRAFPHHHDLPTLSQSLFKSDIWYDLNKGKINESEAIQNFHRLLKIDIIHLQQLMINVKESLTPLESSVELAKNLYKANFSLYALTDNTKEIVQYLQDKYDFWYMFTGIVVSAHIGVMKPSPSIYQHLLNSFQLTAHETVFIDDYGPNVEGAKVMGMHAIQFTDAEQCIADLNKLKILF